MAEAFASQTTLQRTMECPVCFMTYDKDKHLPMALRCQHTLCKSCVDQVATVSVVKCPECRRDTAARDVSTNYLARNMLDALCSECRRTEGDVQCGHCQQMMCSSCVAEHLRIYKLCSEVDTKLKAFTAEINHVTKQLLSDVKPETMNPEQVQRRIQDTCKAYHEAVDRCQRELEKKVYDYKENDVDSLRSWQRAIHNEAESSFTQISSSSSTAKQVVSVGEEHPRESGQLREDTFPKAVNYSFDVVHPSVSSVVASGVSRHTSPYYTTYRVKHITGGPRRGENQLKKPRGIAVSTDGHIIVADCNNHRVKVYDEELTCLSTFGTSGTRAGQFCYIVDVAVAPDGKVYVSDCHNNRIQVFVMAGHEVMKSGEVWVTGLNHPWGLAFDKIGNLYICDVNNYRIQVVQQDGTYLRTIGSKGTGPGQFKERPAYVTVTPDQRVLISESETSLIQVFDTRGRFIETYPKNAPTTLSDMRSRGIATDHVGNIIIADAKGRLVVLDKDGSYSCAVGLSSSGSGQLDSPEGVAVDRFGNILVDDIGSHRLAMLCQ